jgi:hypothetical protein
MTDSNASWAKALTDDIIGTHLRSLASDVRYFTGDQRTALLTEAARRVERPTVTDTLRARLHEEPTTGYLLNQEYGFAEIPAGWTPVQRDDLNDRYDSDEKAAKAAARDKGGVAYAFFPPADDDPDLPGDYAINWAPADGENDPSYNNNIFTSPNAGASMQTDVLVLTIDHHHGFEVSVHHSHQSMMETLADWVAQSWERDGPTGEMPDDTEDAIKAYFDFADETYHVSPAAITENQ